MRQITLTIGLVFLTLLGKAIALPNAFSLQYSVSNGVVEAAALTLRLSGDGNQFTLYGDTRAVGAGKMFAKYLTNTEQSRFMLIDGAVQTTDYRLESHEGVRTWSRNDTSGPGVDRFNLLYQIAIELEKGNTADALQYRSRDNEVRDFSWRVVGSGSMKVAGKDYTVKKIQRDDGDRQIISWHSPENHWFPVKMEFFEDGKLKARALLQSQN